MTLLQTARARLDRMTDALTGPARRDLAMFALLVSYTAAWTLYGVIAKSSQDLHPDMTEIAAWSRDLAFGYSKHPPLAPYLAGLWFAIFQYADWAFYFLAMTMPALTLWFAWRIALRYLDGGKALAAMLLLTFMPFFNVHALKFNANTVLMPAWAATTWWFLVSYETRSRLHAVLAGIAAGVAMLGKYWSVFLLLGLFLAALIDRRRGAYFRSAMPYLTVAAGALVIAPHVTWIFENNFATFRYAAAAHRHEPLGGVLISVFNYLSGSIAYAALPLVLIALLFRPSLSAARDTYLPASQDRRRLAAAFWLPLLVPVAVAPLGGKAINAIWAMPAWSLFGVVFLSSPLVEVPRRALTQLLAFAIMLPLLFLAASPGIAYVIHRNGLPVEQQHLSLLAPEVDRLWRETTPERLRLVCGDTDFANGLAFYSRAHPKICDDPRVFAANQMRRNDKIARLGVAIVCVEDADCHATIDRLAGGVVEPKRRAVELSRGFMGVKGRSERYLIGAIPPQK